VDPVEQLRRALGEMRERQQQIKRKHKGKQRHTDVYRELVVDGAEKVRLPEALLDLTAQAHAGRDRLAEEHQPLALPSRPGQQSTDESSRREAERVAQEMGEEMKAHGIKAPAHYYSSAERSQTGEVDRTYLVSKQEAAEETTPANARRKRSGRPARRT
jgi:hypothetical protein